MTTVMINNNSRTGRQLLKSIGKHPRVAWVINENETDTIVSPPASFGQFKKKFDEDSRNALMPQEFMAEMEQRIRKW